MCSNEPQHAYLKSIQTAKQVHDNPLNCSPAKMQYSFPHSIRFQNRNMASTCNVPFYEVDSSIKRSHRACSLGKGNKYDFTKTKKDVPAPNAYHPTNLSISANLQAKRGFSFGISRELSPQNGILYVSRTAKVKPGPGTYTPMLPKSQATISFHIKTNRKRDENTAIGPGKYDFIPAFEPSKTIFNSKYKSAVGCKFPPVRDTHSATNHKENDEKSAVSNPIKCDLKHQINSSGTFFNSKYHNSLCRSFGKANREVKPLQQNRLGPGEYPLPSEFGLYVSSKFS